MSQNFSSLPPELLVNILQSLSSAKDLYAIIRSSSQFYRIFTTYKRSVLSAILLRAMSRWEVEADFILAYRAQKIWKLTPEHHVRGQYGEHEYTMDEDRGLFDSLNQQSIALLDQFERRKDERLQLSELISHPTHLLDIWIFYCNFEHLIVSYSTRALSNLHQSFFDSNDSLSSIEHTRLQRAFFRWEVYTCLFQISQVFNDDFRFSAPSTDPAPRFAAMLRPWEVEEICCVAQFYKVLAEELSDRIEEDFVATATEKIDARAILNEDPIWRKDGKDGDDEHDGERVEYMLERFRLSWYQESLKRSERSRHIDYLVSRGMLCMRKLTTAPFPIARKMVVRSEPEAHGKIPMLLGLQYSNPREDMSGEEGDSVRRQSGENDSGDNCLGHCNFGWLWAVGDATTRLNANANYELRNQGYVFWDKARLLRFEKFQSPRDPVNDLFEFPFGYEEHSERPGIVTKLNDVPIDRDVLDEISQEIDGDGGRSSSIEWRD